MEISFSAPLFLLLYHTYQKKESPLEKDFLYPSSNKNLVIGKFCGSTRYLQVEFVVNI